VDISTLLGLSQHLTIYLRPTPQKGEEQFNTVIENLKITIAAAIGRAVVTEKVNSTVRGSEVLLRFHLLLS
jgi:hypothetical protein